MRTETRGPRPLREIEMEVEAEGRECLHRRGWPIGSGPGESACRQKQGRFKRPGQFWTPKGMRHLGALTEARHLPSPGRTRPTN